jgi:branched-chain amino acid transport system ATP-binding protein
MLETQDLVVGYGPIVALRGVSVSVPASKIVTVIGSNGAGKSTLLRTICGVLKPIGGTIRLEGSPVGGRSSSEMIRRGVVMVPEGRHVFPEMTVAENLDLGAYYRTDRAGVRADRDRVLAMFPVLYERLRQYAGRMSGGQQQMLAIGRALMARPRLLLLDEPSLGLAPVIVQQLGGIIRNLNRDGTTILLVEQNARMALRLADRAYALATGEIAQSGTGEELLHDPTIHETYLGGVAA